MLKIEAKLLEQEEKDIRYALNYPEIKLANKENNFINYINKNIYEDVLSFKDVVSQIISQEKLDIFINLLTEYRITLNRNNIISIPIEFNQFVGLYNISYINSYNYDLNSEKEIKLKDIFEKEIDYKELLSGLIKVQLTMLSEDYDIEIDEEELVNLINSIEIYEDQTFYLEEDGLVICFSSYEMGNINTSNLEFKIMYEDGFEYFSYYFIREVLL